jgi:putative ABC transport system permease protein
MLNSYLVIAIRHLLRQRLYSAINIFGLAIGMTCAVLIASLIQYELSYDQQYRNSDRIFRISRDFFPSDEEPFELHLAAIAPQAAPLLLQDFPQIEQVARINCCGSVLLSNERNNFYDDGLVMADNELFELFDFEWLEGSAEDALAAPYRLVLTETTAEKYFGSTSPIGRSLVIEGEYSAEVTGVIRDLPHNTHLKFNALLSLSTAESIFGEGYLDDWGSNNFHTYVMLRAGETIDDIQSQSAGFFDRHHFEGASRSTGFTAMRLTDIHLSSGRDHEMTTPASKATLFMLSVIAVLILLIACSNFMNLATARSSQRALEVGLRKTLGAARTQLAGQFLGESVLISLIASMFAIVLTVALLPAFGEFVQRPLTAADAVGAKMLAGLVVLSICVGLVAGSYPAFFLSAFSPARVLKGDITQGQAGASFRKALVVLQFSITITLVIGTAVVFAQMNFARSIELGFSRDQIVILDSSPVAGLGPQWQTIKQQLLEHPAISDVTASNLVPGQRNTNSMSIRIQGGIEADLTNLWVDFDFFETYEIETLAGRLFSEDFGADEMIAAPDGAQWGSASFILNELAARQFGWQPEQAIGMPFQQLTGPNSGVRGQVIGVVGNVHFESVHHPTLPMLFIVPPQELLPFPALRQASVRISALDIPSALNYIDQTWAEFMPEQPVARRFLDDDFDLLYLAEERQAKILGGFSLLAIIIASLGLFALTSFTTSRRTMEIGVRKAFGAGTWDIVRLFSAETSGLVLVANAIAWPLSYIVMQRWLESYTYRIGMNPLFYLCASALAFIVAWLTVGLVSAKAANNNPILALRNL